MIQNTIAKKADGSWGIKQTYSRLQKIQNTPHFLLYFGLPYRKIYGSSVGRPPPLSCVDSTISQGKAAATTTATANNNITTEVLEKEASAEHQISADHGA